MTSFGCHRLPEGHDQALGLIPFVEGDVAPAHSGLADRHGHEDFDAPPSDKHTIPANVELRDFRNVGRQKSVHATRSPKEGPSKIVTRSTQIKVNTPSPPDGEGGEQVIGLPPTFLVLA